MRARKLYQEALAAARSSGSFHELPISLFFCAHADAVQQRVVEAAASATEGIAIARELGQENLETVFLALLARVAAFQGNEARVSFVGGRRDTSGTRSQSRYRLCKRAARARRA